jgi:hypothetical protein
MMKSLRAVMLMLAMVTMFAHMVIPHDHHMSGPMNGVEDNCPVHGEKSGHHPLFPHHCHAFNDMAAEKFTLVIRHHDNGSFIMIIHENGFLICGLNAAGPANLTFAEHSPVLYLIDLSPFRAPPSVT